LIDIYPVNDAGNLFDAAALAALAALKDAKFPKIEDGKISYRESTGQKLPLEKLPLSCTVYKIGNYFLVDPVSEEELIVDARLTVGVLEDGTLCSLQKGGDFGLNPEEVDQMVDVAVKKTKELRKVL